MVVSLSNTQLLSQVLTAEQLDKVGFYLGRSVNADDLTQSAWRRQTDTLQLAFISATFFAGLETRRGEALRCVFVDGHISDRMKSTFFQSGDPLKEFFNRRFHDAGVKSRRIVAFDTVTTKKMGGRGTGKARLHFHGAFELAPGQTQTDLLKKLEKVFGRAERQEPITGHAVKMGKRQFHVSLPDQKLFSSHNGVQVHGPLGKMLYAIKHAGSTYRCLGLNEDERRSRRAPPTRGSCNRRSGRLARGIPSNFNKDVVFFDRLSKQAGREAFEAWLNAARTPHVMGPRPANDIEETEIAETPAAQSA